jgi:glutamate--cysteine ligase
MEAPQTLSTDIRTVIDELMLGNPMALGHRALGVEFERLLLHKESRESAPLAVSRGLIERMCGRVGGEPMIEDEVVKGFSADGFSMSLEPGGQIELASPPARSMAELDRVFETVDPMLADELAADAASKDYEFVALGHAPVTPVARLGLLPRQRYRIMDRFMVDRGPLSRNMMRATAGFQLTYDVADRADAARKLALLNRISPLLAAWTANSREVEGRDSGYASFRQHVWLQTDTDRSGIPEGGLDPERVLRAYQDFALDAVVLFRYAKDGSFEAVGDRTLAQLSAEASRGGRVVTRADVDLHLTSLFPQVRLRNYVEVRCFDAVEWREARSIQALVSGIVYCDIATAHTEEITKPLDVRDPAALRDLHERTARTGLSTPVVEGSSLTLRDVGRELLETSAGTLGGASCDWAAPSDLDAIRARLDA